MHINPKIKNPILKHISSSIKHENNLSLETLLEYITNNVSNLNNSTIQALHMDNTNEPDVNHFIELNNLGHNLTDIIDGVFFKRFGVIKNTSGKLKYYSNLSLLSSLASCLDKKFILLDKELQINYLKSLKLYIFNSFSKSFYDLHNYKSFNINRDVVSKNLYNFDISDIEMSIISDIFHINIFVLDVKLDKLLFCGNNFIPYKKNIFLLKKHDGFFEPLSLNDCFYVDHEHDLMQYLLENNTKVELTLKNNNFNEFTIYFDNYNMYLKKEIKLDIKNKILERQLHNLNKSNTDSININKDTNECTDDNSLSDDVNNLENENKKINDYTENKHMSEYNIATELCSLSDNDNSDNDDNDNDDNICMEKTKHKYNMTELKKLKVAELLEISIKLGITFKKKPTKNILIEEILKN